MLWRMSIFPRTLKTGSSDKMKIDVAKLESKRTPAERRQIPHADPRPILRSCAFPESLKGHKSGVLLWPDVVRKNVEKRRPAIETV